MPKSTSASLNADRVQLAEVQVELDSAMRAARDYYERADKHVAELREAVAGLIGCVLALSRLMKRMTEATRRP